MFRREKRFDDKATAVARHFLAELKVKYGVTFPIREPRVYSYGSSRLAELLRFISRDFLCWPIAALRRETPFLGTYDIGSFLLGEVPILLTLRSIDAATLEHEVRHHLSYECKRYPYVKSSSALDFLREYYWEERHSGIAEEKLQALRRNREISRKMGEKQYEEALVLFEDLSRGEFPENRYLPDAVACIITEATPWVSEGFAAEQSLAEVAKVPLKLLLGAATLGFLYSGAPLFLSLSLPSSPVFIYLSGGLLNVSYGFLRTLPLDIGALRWRRMRAGIKDEDIPKVLAYPPTDSKTVRDILLKLEEYPIF